MNKGKTAPGWIPTKERIREVLEYRDGHLWWLKKINPACRMDQPAGTEDKRLGYHYIGLDGKMHLLHRLVWAYFHGDPGDFEIDHIDNNPRNNRLENLRLATHAENLQNRKRRSGGVLFSREKGRQKRFVARIWLQGKAVHLGWFRTYEDAKLVRDCAEIIFHPFSNKKHRVTV